MDFGWMADLMGSRRRVRRAGGELLRTLDLARRLAARSDRTVTLGAEPAPGRLSPRLPKGYAWGKPKGVPLPPGALDPRWGVRPGLLRVSPWGTATEGMWFVHRGGTVLCLHLRAGGDCRLLAYGALTRHWTEA